MMKLAPELVRTSNPVLSEAQHAPAGLRRPPHAPAGLRRPPHAPAGLRRPPHSPAGLRRPPLSTQKEIVCQTRVSQTRKANIV